MADATIGTRVTPGLRKQAAADLLPEGCREPIVLEELLEECVSRKRNFAYERGVSVHVSLRGKAVTLNGSAPLLRTTIEHVLDNAIRYNRHGGKVIVRHESEGGADVIVISDNGVGIPAGDLGSVCEPFFRTSRAAELAPDRNGLGLTVARELIGMLDGWIHIGSCAGRGTIVSIYMPLKGRPF